MKKLLVIFVFSLLFVVASNAQCAMCKSSVESNQKEQVFRAKERAEGLNAGILYLMSLPYLILGTIGYFWYKNSKAEKELREKESLLSQFRASN